MKLFALLLMMAGAMLAFAAPAMAALPPIPTFGSRRWPRIREHEELILISQAQRYGVDADFLAALRLTENGGPGREMGVLVAEANTFELQASWAAGTVAKTLDRFRRETGLDPGLPYSEDFLRYFSWGILPNGQKAREYPGYAPLGASNDPTGLNANHFGNLRANYATV